MRTIFIAAFITATGILQLYGQDNNSLKLSEYFNEVSKTTSKHKALWNVDLYGPILLVDPKTREVFANENDSSGVLVPGHGIFRGNLPNNINIANTSVSWMGKRWAMVLLPLPTNRNERLSLITHELFHCVQPMLKFNTINTDNNHLDKEHGRTYLRLELEALSQAIQSSSFDVATPHIINAMMFRELRHQMYADADSTENMLELNEGLAEYTGLIMSERSQKEIVEHLMKSVRDFQQSKTFVRSFAYQTIPLYGFLTHKFVREFWNRDIIPQTNLTAYFMRSFGIKIPINIETYTSKVWLNYNGAQISQDEKMREENNARLINEMTIKFVKNPHLEISFERMNISFDPGNLIPLENYGTVYPNLRITDDWGILTVADGALLSADWSKVTVTIPEEINKHLVRGKGWRLELNSDKYIIIQDEASSNYYLKKK